MVLVSVYVMWLNEQNSDRNRENVEWNIELIR